MTDEVDLKHPLLGSDMETEVRRKEMWQLLEVVIVSWKVYIVYIGLLCMFFYVCRGVMHVCKANKYLQYVYYYYYY